MTGLRTSEVTVWTNWAGWVKQRVHEPIWSGRKSQSYESAGDSMSSDEWTDELVGRGGDFAVESADVAALALAL